MNNKNNMKRLAAISLAVMGIMLVFAQFDAARMNREIKELQKTVNYTQLFEDLLRIWMRVPIPKRKSLRRIPDIMSLLVRWSFPIRSRNSWKLPHGLTA